MKLNKLKQADYVKKFKYFIIAPLVFLLAGIILLCAVGFNQGIDFTGGTIVNVYVGDNLENQNVYNQAKQKIDDVLEDKPTPTKTETFHSSIADEILR